MQFLFNYLGEWKCVWLCYLLFDKSPDTNKIRVNWRLSSNKRVDVKAYSFIAVQDINQFYIYHQINFSISLTDSLHTLPFLGCFELPLSSYWFSPINELNKTWSTWLFYVCMRVVFIFLKIILGWNLDG